MKVLNEYLKKKLGVLQKKTILFCEKKLNLKKKTGNVLLLYLWCICFRFGTANSGVSVRITKKKEKQNEF